MLPPNPFDDFLDRLLRGDDVDVAEFLKAHPGLEADERAQLLRLCGPPGSSTPSATTTVADGRLAAEGPPLARIGSLRLGKRIGAGGMGAVFLAEDESLGRPIAVKILGPDLLGAGERAERFVREVRAVARLHHPNIVNVYSAGEQDGLRYMAMELIDGAGLDERMSEAALRGTRLAVADLLRWGAEIARALAAAHAAGIIHRDIKPSNIRIAASGRAVLLDFGLAHEVGGAALTAEGAFRGSPQYASPEQVGLAGVTIDPRTDVYSLGATLYEALTGVAPFRGETREQLFNAILSSEPVPPRRLNPGIPRDLETVILAALEKDPARRHPTAEALASDLEAVCDGRPVSVRPVSPAGRLVRWARRRPARAALLAALILSLPTITLLGIYIGNNLSKIEAAEASERARKFELLLEDAFLGQGEGDRTRSKQMFEEALRLDSGSPEANAGYVLTVMRTDGPAAALAFLDGPAARHAEANWSRLLRIEALQRLGRNEEANADVPKLGPLRAAIDHFVGGLLALDRFHAHQSPQIRVEAAKAFEHLQGAVYGATTTANRLHHFELGHAAWHAGRHDEARKIARAIEVLWPPSPERWFAIGRTLIDADREAAIDAFEKASNPPPRALDAQAVIVLYLCESGRGEPVIDLALGLAREAVAAEPLRGRSHRSLGVALMAKGDRGAARASFEEALRLDPDDPGVRIQLAHLYLLAKEFSKAETTAREITQLAPENYAGWLLVGTALVARERIEESFEPFEKALVLNPEDPSTLCELGRALLRHGDFKEGLAKIRAGHELGSAQFRRGTPVDKWLANAERLVQLEARLEEVRGGAGRPLTAVERGTIARLVCRPKGRFAEAASLYADAFSAAPKMATQKSPNLRLEAAVASLTAGLGGGTDAPGDPAERMKLRDRGREWLTAELESLEGRNRDDASAQDRIASTLDEWKSHAFIAKLRQPRAEDGILPAEAEEWRRLWERHDLLMTVQDRP